MSDDEVTGPIDGSRSADFAVVHDKLRLDRALRSFSMRRTGMAVSPDASSVVQFRNGERFIVLRNDDGIHIAIYRCEANGGVTPDDDPPDYLIEALASGN